MLGGPEKLNSTLPATSSTQASESLTKAMDRPIETIVSGNSFSELLELAAENDVEGFKSLVLDDPCKIDEVGLWYACQTAQRRTVLLHRCPLMVASIYGSVEVLNFILSVSKEDINRSCDSDKSTALHCAASGGSAKAVDVVKSLLLAGADPDATDRHGKRPFDVIASAPNLKAALKEMLRSETDVLQVSGVTSSIPIPTSPPLSSSLENGSMWSPSAKKEYPIDPSIPDIRNSIYASDEFRMFSFKIRPCSRSYTHDWTECPFVHPGENARRRDPKKFHYSCVPCPDHRKAPCRRGDSCEYAHGVFESLLHPAQYRTRICKDGVSCARRVCFFAHKPEELRPLYLSTGSAVPSPPHSAIEMASARNPMSPPPFAPPISPGNGASQGSMPWPQQNIPTLQLPGNNLQISRLRSSLTARDVQMSLNDFSCFSPNRSLRSNDLGSPKLGEVLSPRYSDQFVSSPVFSPSQKLPFINQQSKREFMLSPIKTHMFSPKNIEHPLQGIEPISPMRSRASSLANRENQMRSLSSRDLGSNLSRDAVHNLPGDLETSDFVGSPVNCWSQWESPMKKADWSVQGDELDRLRKSFSTGHNTMDPEVSSVRSAVKELPSDIMAMSNTFSIECPNTKPNDQVVALA